MKTVMLSVRVLDIATEKKEWDNVDGHQIKDIKGLSWRYFTASEITDCNAVEEGVTHSYTVTLQRLCKYRFDTIEAESGDRAMFIALKMLDENDNTLECLESTTTQKATAALSDG